MKLDLTRQLNLLGLTGQKRVQDSHVLVVGVGGLGCPAALGLALSGVGCLTLVDPDQVEASNLHRQTLYRAEDIGSKKVEVAVDQLKTFRPDVKIFKQAKTFDPQDLKGSKFDLVIDGTDSFEAREWINQFCVTREIPLISGSLFKNQGQVFFYQPGGACLKCLYPEYPTKAESCSEAGVIGAFTQVVGSLQAHLAIQYLAGILKEPHPELLWVDHDTWKNKNIKVPKSPDCIVCSSQDRLKPMGLFSKKPDLAEIHPQDIASLDKDHYVILDVREDWEIDKASFGGDQMVSIPLNDLTEKWQTLPQDKTIYCLCHHGRRSQMAQKFLLEQGLKDVVNLKGGIDLISLEVDSSIPRY